jgi:hypothetical protein
MQKGGLRAAFLLPSLEDSVAFYQVSQRLPAI